MERKIKRYNYFGDRLNDIMNDFAHYFSEAPFTTTYFGSRILVDPSKYEITPRKEQFEILINRAQERIEALDRQHESDEGYYKNKREELTAEKERLLRERDNKIKT